MSTEVPTWVTDNTLIERLLHLFVDMCEPPVSSTYSQKLTSSAWPELFDFSNNEHASLWCVIEQKLHSEHSIIKPIRYGSERKIEDERIVYDHVTLDFNPSKEPLVRHWLHRPAQLAYAKQWSLALEGFPEFRSGPLAAKIQHKTASAHEILIGFKVAKTLIDTMDVQMQRISLRGLSARCFWGDSKFLDHRRNLINALFPNAINVVRNRLIMMSAYVPENLKRVIFVENFDSFLSLVAAIRDSNHEYCTAIIYSAGYRGAASAIRERGESQFLTINISTERSVSEFQNWWYQETDRQVECLFWGDLDFEGLKILSSLRVNFPGTVAWRGAYELIVEYHREGLGHRPDQAGKENQKLPENTGCDYSDKVLRPLLLESVRFIDQEVINKAQLMKVLSRFKTL